jgi:hypothetical protein
MNTARKLRPPTHANRGGVLFANHLPKLGAHLATALARLRVHNLARRSSLEAESSQKKKGGEEWINVKNSVW